MKPGRHASINGVRTSAAIVTPIEADESLGGRLAELYVRHAPAAIGFAYLLTADKGLAEDLVQEAFIRAGGRFRHIRQVESFDAYLRKTIVNLYRSQLRRRKLERAYLKREAHRVLPETDPAPDQEMRDERRRALQTLPARQRAAIVLRYYEDMSENDAAELMGCSNAALRSLVSRGMSVLRQEMRRQEP